MPILKNTLAKENMFFLCTSGIAYCGWIIAFGSACDLKVQSGLTWWVIIYELLLTSVITHLTFSGLFMQYRLAVLTFLAASISLLSQQIEISLLEAKLLDDSAQKAKAAGLIILIIIRFVWVIVFGSESDSAVSHSLARLVSRNNSVTQSPSRRIDPADMSSEKIFYRDNSITRRSMNLLPNSNSSPIQSPPHTFSYNSTGPHNDINPTTTNATNTANTTSNPTSPYLENVASDAVPSMVHGPLEPMEYTERVEALHAYQANRDDPTELSFEKFETLEIASRAGNWWQARKMDGTVGIIPSNYFAPV
ncbi:hypothetical protein J3Q64DRAFT_1151821 [Phycomyces blakesleeanus]|uniref:SH3 domain-containing protein n=1 Tax=Phycomyces blakesleeanus TaxID=4837 RepID=A0ABR3AVW3_PHYBL